MPLLDSLQGGGSYPAVAPTGRNLLDMLKDALSSDPSAQTPDSPSAADLAYAQATRDANAQLAPKSQFSGQPYAMGTQDPNATPAFAPGTGSPAGFGGSAPVAAPLVASPAPVTAARPAVRAPQVGSNLFSPSGSLPLQAVGDGSIPAVQAGQDSPQDLTQPPVDGSPDVQGGSTTSGLLGDLQGAAQDPEQAHGLLQSFGEKAKALGEKLTSLSPNASQALLAGGLSMLASNDGTRNLGQVVGIGGISGINNYQSNVQNQARNAIANQQLDIKNRQLQQEQFLKLRQQQLEEWKAKNTPIVVAPGSGVTTNDRVAQGLPPIGGGDAVKEYRKVQGPDGVTYNQAFGYSGQAIGQPTVESDPYVGPLNGDERKAVEGYQTQVATGKQNLSRINQYLQQLSPTMVDANGQTVANPNFVDVPGGLQAHAQNLWTKLTGDQNAAQQLRTQIAQSVTKDQLLQYKEGVGGRLTNADINLLSAGLPTGSGNGEALYNYLKKYATYQEDVINHQAKQADFAAANRGDLSPLNRSTTINGVTVPKGTTFQDYVSGKFAKSGAQSTGGGNPATLLMQVRTAARNGNADAQNELKKRGLTW
jgi:hypothetical protein